MDYLKDEIVASLEGMKVVVTPDHCELHEYHFEENAWHEVAMSPRPIPADEAELWLAGWNTVDRSSAFVLLTSPEPTSNEAL